MTAALAEMLERLGLRFSIDPGDLQAYGRDWTRAFAANAAAVVWPANTDQVSDILRFCSEHRLAVVPSGGRTGLAGGAVATRGEIVLSLDRLGDLDPVDTAGRSVEVGAGVTNQALQDHLRPHGLWWPVDLASKGSAQIGGNLATNAGGLRVLRYGHARHWLLGVQAVKMDGSVLQLGGPLAKDNSGYALAQLLAGSEGTLAVMTRATLALAPLPGPTQTLLLACPSLGAVVRALAWLRSRPITLDAFEVFSDLCVEHVARHTGQRRPLPTSAPWYALVAFEDPQDSQTDAILVGLLDGGLASDGAVAVDRQHAQRLWQWRERITESLQAFTPHKNDIAVPVAALPAFGADLLAWLNRQALPLPIAVFGHVGDGNLHLNTLRPVDWSAERFSATCDELDGDLFALVAKHRGSISAEHGIGLVKKPWLHLTRGPAEVATMRAVKRAWDPQGLLNPGKIFDTHPT